MTFNKIMATTTNNQEFATKNSPVIYTQHITIFLVANMPYFLIENGRGQLYSSYKAHFYLNKASCFSND